MENTIYDKHYCLVQRRSFSVERGDIITVNTSNTSTEHIIIKRVVATDGDRLIFMESENGIYVDLYICKAGKNSFEPIKEPYIKERMLKKAGVYDKIFILKYNDLITEIPALDHSIANYTITVPENCVYVLGDNRNNSRDSRYYGALNKSRITSKILAIL